MPKNVSCFDGETRSWSTVNKMQITQIRSRQTKRRRRNLCTNKKCSRKCLWAPQDLASLDEVPLCRVINIHMRPIIKINNSTYISHSELTWQHNQGTKKTWTFNTKLMGQTLSHAKHSFRSTDFASPFFLFCICKSVDTLAYETCSLIGISICKDEKADWDVCRGYSLEFSARNSETSISTHLSIFPLKTSHRHFCEMIFCVKLFLSGLTSCFSSVEIAPKVTSKLQPACQALFYCIFRSVLSREMTNQGFTTDVTGGSVVVFIFTLCL